MPFVNIRITREQTPVTPEQKERLIKGVTDLIAETLGRNPATTIVIIDEIEMDNYGIGGESVTNRRRQGK